MSAKIHIATVHWPRGEWIPIQQYYLKKNIQEDFSTYAVIAPGTKTGDSHFDYLDISKENDHARHLNHLLKVVLERVDKDEEILIFLDGDAFPIASLDRYLKDGLSKDPMIALERLENAGEFIPHPGFCAARIGWWKEIGENWGSGSYIKEFGKDPGVKMYEELKMRDVEWGKMHRTNVTNLHPLFFGIYDNVIYHHGAGFRDPISRFDMESPDMKAKRTRLLSRMMEPLPNALFLRCKRRISPFRREEYLVIQKNRRLHSKVFTQIQENDTFFRQFI